MKIKICGLTKIEEAEYLNQNRVDFAGFVLFFPKSKRNNTIVQAKEIMKHLHPEIKRVAVVVSPSMDEIKQIAAAGFDYIQIHGTLLPELLPQIPLPVIKAFNLQDRKNYEIYRHRPEIAGYLFDAAEPGSGKTFDWHLIKQIPRDKKFLLLAGGLQENNVLDAIQEIHPDGVDVSSGVEYNDMPGKDPEKIKNFVNRVRQYHQS